MIIHSKLSKMKNKILPSTFLQGNYSIETFKGNSAMPHIVCLGKTRLIHYSVN